MLMIVFMALFMSVLTAGLAGKVKIEKISQMRGILSESPFWDEEAQLIYWLDIKGATISKYDGNKVSTVHIDGGQISGIVPIADNPGYFVIGIGSDLYLQRWFSESEVRNKILTAVDLGKPENRVNDAKCDSNGRYWFGTIGSEINGNITPLQGTLYLANHENYLSPEAKITPVSISNGMAWTRDDKQYFYIDSPTRVVAGYDYNSSSGDISNRRVVFDFNKYNITGVPDGMTIDKRDNLWIAVYGGGVVLKVNSTDGVLLATYPIPAVQVTSVMWGGPNLDILFVTTGSQFMNKEQLAHNPGAGHVYSVKGLGESGWKSNKFDLREKLDF